MFEKCNACSYCKCYPATFEDPAEYECEKDMDEFYEDEEVDCPMFKDDVDDYWDEYAYEEDIVWLRKFED